MRSWQHYYSDHAVFLDAVHSFIHSEIAPKLDEWEKKARFPDDVFQKLGAQGFLGILMPEEYGGSGGDLRLAAAWCEAFGELCAVGFTTAVNMHSLVISNALNRFGTDEAKAHWLPNAVLGKAIGAYAFTEPGVGSDLANLRTTALKSGGDWIINGSKTFITNGARAHFVLVLARTDPKAGYKGFTTFLVDTKTPGFKVSRTLEKLGWHSSDTAELVFENVKVPVSCVLGKVGEGWGQAADSLNWERLMLTLTSLAGARAAFRSALKYSRERSCFGKLVGEFGVIGEMLSGMFRRIVLGEALSHHALELLVAGRPCRAEVSMAKRMVCEDAIWVADRAIQIHGGYGYTTEFPPERWLRDLRLMTIGGGTSEIMANIVAKELKLT